MRRWMAVATAAAAALAVAGVLGPAQAQPPSATTTAAPRLVTVNGGSSSDVTSGAPAADRRAAYRAALAAAIDDAKAKAAFVAERSGVALGAVHSVTEQTGSVLDGCVAFATGTSGAGEARPLPAVRKPRRKTNRGRSAQDVPTGPYTCQVVASVAVSYAVSG